MRVAMLALGSMLLAGCGGGGGSGDAAGGDGDGGGVPADAAPPPPPCPDPPVAPGPDGVTPGAMSLPHPTLHHLTIEWPFQGDPDGDATTTVRFRADGGEWRQGAPLFRAPAGAVAGKSWGDRFAGSLFALAPDTGYEVEVTMRDPDGGCALATLTTRTRPVPAPMPGAPVVAVTPANLSAALGAAQPGQILELAAGSYPGFTVAVDGAAGQPLVIRAAAGATAAIGGDVRLDGRQHVHVVGLTITGKIKFNDGRDLAIVGNTITTTEDGITTKTRAERAYIADNVVTGATAWNEAALGVSGANVGEGIEVTGPGHVILHNRVRGFRDCVSLLEDSNADEQVAIDIIGNDLSECADDGVEADFCAHDCRVVGNRLTNTFIALSSQPGLGGPTYFVRNVVANTLLTAFKLQRGSIGDVLVNNTVVKRGDAFGVFTTDVFSRVWARNNLFLGGAGGSYGGYDIGDGAVIELRALDVATSSLDHDGYGSSAGFAGRFGPIAFSSLAELRAMTSEAHAVEVTPAVFATPSSPPASPFPSITPPDLRLAPGGAAIDVGQVIPNLADGHVGAAPDLGAYELGAALPAYGPR
jgi:hypothetical protein